MKLDWLDDAGRWLAGIDYPVWLGVFFTGVAAFYTALNYHAKKRERDARADLAVSEQARAIKVTNVKQTGGAVGTGHGLRYSVAFSVTNDSSHAIHDVRVRCRTLPADAVIEGGSLDQHRVLFASKHSETFSLQVVVKRVDGATAHATTAPEVEFTDHNDRRWKIGRDYRLAQVER